MIVRDDEYLDFSQVPESRGIPAALYRVVFIGLLDYLRDRRIGLSALRLWAPLAVEHHASRPPSITHSLNSAQSAGRGARI